MERIYKILLEWKEECKAKGIVQIKYSNGVLTICTHYVGYFIGRAGCYVDKYREIFVNEIYGFKEITFIETDNDYIED